MAKDRSNRSGKESDLPASDLKSERDQFLKKFTRGNKLTEEFIQEYDRLLQRLNAVETENADLRAKLAADSAVRELISKIEQLEAEKSELLSRFRRAEAMSHQFTERVAEVETEIANLANLFVASNQLHSSLSPRGVTRRIKEVLAQLVGAEKYCVYLVNPEGTELVPIASEGVPGKDLMTLRVDGTRVGEAFKSGRALIDGELDPSHGSFDTPPAVVPLSIEERVVGVIAIFSTLTQKTRFDAVDFELFKLLGQHAAAALVSASLFAQAERKLPGLEAFLDLSV